jgi:hypothetical protein
MREDARFLSHTANSVTNHQITKRKYRSAAANLTDADTHGRAAVASFGHVPEVRTSVLAPVGTFRANKDLETPPSTPPASPTPHDFDRYDRGPGPYPTVSDDVRISEAYKLAPQTLFKGPAGRELRRQMNRENPRGRRGPSLRPFDRDTKPGGCRSVEGQQKTQERLNWLKAPAIESSTDASVIWAAADARLPKEEPPRLEATAPVAKDLPMVKATPSVSLDDAASWLSDAVPKEFDGLFAGQAPAPAPGEELLDPPQCDYKDIESVLHTFVGAIPRGAYDDHERETLEKVLGTQASARLVGLSVHLVYWSVIYPAFRGHSEGYLRHGAHDEDNHDQLYAECLAAFGHVKTDLVTTARRKRVKDIRVNGALLPVVVLAVKRSVDDILSRTYAYLELEEGKALLQQGLATLGEIIDAGEFNAPVFVGHHRYHTFEGVIIHVREDQEYDVQYDEGGTETRVPARCINRRTGPSVDKVPLTLGEAVEVHSDRHRVPEISYHRAALVGNRHRATSAAATALYADSLDPKIRMLARPTSRLCGAVPKTPGSVPTTAQSAVYRDLASSVGYSAQRPHVSPFPRKDNGRILARMKHKYRDLLSQKPDYTPHTRGPGREQPAFWAVDNHAYQERRHATPFNGDSHFK